MVPSKLLVAASALLVSHACAAPSGPRLLVSVAPLGLEGVERVCWDLAVENSTGVVWARGVPSATAGGHPQRSEGDEPDISPVPPDAGTLCSDRYGAGPAGGITFVGACDFGGDTNREKDGVQNRVRVWIDGLYPGPSLGEDEAGVPERMGWTDPCPEGCVVEADCLENADTLVEFNLTIMRLSRDASVAAVVDVEKYESCAGFYTSCEDGEPKRLLLGRDDVPDPTAVFNFGCFFRENAPSPEVYYGTPTVTCDNGDAVPSNDVTFSLPIACGDARLGVTLGNMQLEYRVSNDAEPSGCGSAGGLSCVAASSAFAINTSTLAPHTNCRLRLVATIAATGDFVAAIPSGDMGLYPYMVLDAQLTDASGAPVCNQSLLDGTGGFLATEYWGPLTSLPYEPLCALYEPGDVSMSSTGQCPATTCADYESSSCSDGVRNGLETDVDCGGGICPDCAGGVQCFVGSDCASGICQQEIFTCVPPAIGPEVVGGVTRYSVVVDAAGYRRWDDGTVAVSCDAYRIGDATHLYRGQTGSGRYRIAPSGTAYDVYCDMTTDGGGWTLVMKVDGDASTFAYDSPHWTTSTVHEDGAVAFDDMEAKYRSFNEVAFNALRVGMFGGGEVTIAKSATSVRSLIAAGSFESTNVGRAGWLGLMSGSALQSGCEREGFNVTCGTTRARIGIVGDDDAACASCESRLGLGTDGTAGGQSGANVCGNEARNIGAGGDRSMRSVGYIFVR